MVEDVALIAPSNPSNPEWTIDTGTTNHMTSNSKLLNKDTINKTIVPKRAPTTALNNLSAYEKYYNCVPSLNHLSILGCLCFAKDLTQHDRMQSRAKIAIHMGYSDTQKGYVIYDLANNVFFVNRDVVFNEDILPFKIKYATSKSCKANGDIERFKARLVAKGYSQKEGIDYQETFSLIVKMVPVRTVLSIAAAKKWHIHEINVYNAFLQGYLYDEIYMELPKGFSSHREKSVCRLIKSLYGLKQAPTQWNAKLPKALIKFNFKQSQYDHSLFIKWSKAL
ncbi:uncharacterized protein LOC132630969 [Lycium barbarum]|uniref:uncharacterized protein LOC132630969 n=1 Tax=Lycium barbarum TaxID=112863 RepID=UPI00293F617E|nr:uncharacterized protein LOC132630969 [Lycium barbarum]